MSGLLATDKVAVLAPSEWGKTSLARILIRGIRRTLVLDPAGTFPADTDDLVVESIPEFGAMVKIILAHKAKEFCVIRRYPRGFADFQADLDFAIRLAYVIGEEIGPVMIVADEFQEFMNRETISSELKSLILRGRHDLVGVMGISQRAAEVSKTFIGMCKHIFVGGFFTENDLNFVRGLLGKEGVNSVRKLKVSGFLHYQRPNIVTPLAPLFRAK